MTFSASSQELKRWEGDPPALKEDLALIEAEANWKQDTLQFAFSTGKNDVSIKCSRESITLLVKSSPEERVSTLYHGLFKLGFLFPHPRWQISPSMKEALSHCGNTYSWKPSFKKRGFHLHTLHPNEWVKGFLEGDEKIATDMVRWLARNRQNLLDLSLMRPDFKETLLSLKKPFILAKNLGISRGVSIGATFQQQNSFKLIGFFKALTGYQDERSLIKGINKLSKSLDYDFLVMEIGTSEFTSTNYERTLSWLNAASEELVKSGKKLLTKIHVSTNQVSPQWGNFNFLPRFASKDIGVLPHTVMFYGLEDPKAPMYGNKNFHHLLTFIQEEKNQREVWYYPETSYWVGMDIDIPLLLTDYLSSRAADMKLTHEEGIDGHINFTSGHELGGWLLDWNVALNTDLDLAFDPLIGVKLLGEDETLWKDELDFQTKHFKNNQLISILSASNVQDELSSKHRIHTRKTIKEIAQSPLLRESEINKLEEAIKEAPLSFVKIKNNELRALLEVTHLRMEHSLLIRKALRFKPKSRDRITFLDKAKEIREEALERLQAVKKSYSRYPETNIFKKDKNVTSYDFGYLWTAMTLHFWEREELMIRKNSYSPFFLNIYNFIDILF